MRARGTVLSTVLLLLGVRALAAPDLPAYSVTDLKSLGIWPVAMNERGEVLGRACCGRQSTAPQLYTAGNVRDLGLPPGGYGSFTFTQQGFNDSGWVAGGAVIPAADPAARVFSAALYDGNSWKVIDTSGLGTVTLGASINSAGQVIGTTENKLDGRFHAWVYDGGLPLSVGPGFVCYAGAISNDGEVVGSCGFDYDTSLWAYRDGRVIGLPGSGRPIAVNNAGTVVVSVPRLHYPGIDVPGYFAVIENGAWSKLDGWGSGPAMNERSELAGGVGGHAAVYRSGTTFDLGTLGGAESSAHSINNRGQVAGSSLDADGQKRLFVYDGGVMLDLASLRGVGSSLQYGSLSSPIVRINDSMYLLVIAAAGPDTLDAAYLLTPIAPAVTLTAKPVQAPVRQPVALTWVSENSNSCVASGGISGDGWAGERPTSGEVSVTSGAEGAAEYALRCTAGPLSGEATVSVRYDAAPPTVRLSATPSESKVGKSVTLAWTSEGANDCVATGGLTGDGWAGPLATSGQKSVSETTRGTVEYGLRCTAAALASEAKVSVTYTKKSGGGGSLGALVVLLGLGLARRKAS
jgi:probable HAF family extracellular repeat protein